MSFRRDSISRKRTQPSTRPQVKVLHNPRLDRIRTRESCAYSSYRTQHTNVDSRQETTRTNHARRTQRFTGHSIHVHTFHVHVSRSSRTGMCWCSANWVAVRAPPAEVAVGGAPWAWEVAWAWETACTGVTEAAVTAGVALAAVPGAVAVDLHAVGDYHSPCSLLHRRTDHTQRRCRCRRSRRPSRRRSWSRTHPAATAAGRAARAATGLAAVGWVRQAETAARAGQRVGRGPARGR